SVSHRERCAVASDERMGLDRRFGRRQHRRRDHYRRWLAGELAVHARDRACCRSHLPRGLRYRLRPRAEVLPECTHVAARDLDLASHPAALEDLLQRHWLCDNATDRSMTRCTVECSNCMPDFVEHTRTT